jgi:transposase
MAVVSPDGEVLIELQVETSPEELRRVVSDIPGPKRVLMENGPPLGDGPPGTAGRTRRRPGGRGRGGRLVRPGEERARVALGQLAGTPGRIGNDRLDARRLGTLSLVRATREVHVPPEPYRAPRSLVHYDHMLAEAVTRTKLQLKAMLRRYTIPCRGRSVYRRAGRKEILSGLPNACARSQPGGLCRQLDGLRLERVRACRMVSKHATKVPVIGRPRGVPGLGPRTAPTLAAWLAAPGRFRSEPGLSSHAGPGLKDDFSNWKRTKRARASKRGDRELKRALFLPARGALKGTSALRRRYDAGIAAGWDDRKAIRDVARTILFVACAVWRSGKEYDDTRAGTGGNDGAR